MRFLTIKEYFPAGGQAQTEIEITDISYTDRDNVILGTATLPLSNVAKNVVILRKRVT